MAITIKTPRQVAQEYLDNLKALRPEVNINQTDSDWWIRSRVVGGLLAGAYGDLNRVSNDAFPQTARREAVDKHLQTWFGAGLRAAQPAEGSVTVIGTIGSTIPSGTQLTHAETGNLYSTNTTASLSSTAGDFPVTSIASGADQNLITGTPLAFSSPPAGITTAATVAAPGILDGRDEETTSAGAERVLTRIRNPSRGGTAADYAIWALAADVSVVSAAVNRHAYGLGTVQVIITAGTSDIDAAIDAGDPVVIAPSPATKAAVLAYIEGMNPICDVAYVDGATEVAIDLTATITWITGDHDTVVSGTTETQGELLIKEISRALYKMPIGGRDVAGVKEIRASEIEGAIDYYLGGGQYGVGLKYQIVGDRAIALSGGTPNVTIAATEAATPGTITIVDV